MLVFACATMKRTMDHLAKAKYPDPEYYFNVVQKYFFRPDELQPLRIGQFLRFFMYGSDEHKFTPPAKRVDENTLQPDALVEVDRCHRHYQPRPLFHRSLC